MSTPTATAYPWKALESVTRESAKRASRARRQTQTVLEPSLIESALRELCDCEVSVIIRRVSSEPPRRRPLAELGFELGTSGVVCALAVEPELAANVLGRVLRRPIALSTQTALEETLAGAFSAVILEVARRCSARAALRVLDSSEALARARDVFVEATVLLAGTAHQAVVALGLAELEAPQAAQLSALGELPIAVPVVIGLGLADRAELSDLSPGNAWFPGGGLWIDPQGEGRIAFAAGTRDDGISGTLSRDGKIVIRGESVALPFDSNDARPDSGRDEPMSDSEKPDPSRLSEAVLDSPIVVRLEMGAVSMTAREWAELGPGDVIETGRRIAEPVILRVAGREVARGELVNLEGELGVRIRELVRS